MSFETDLFATLGPLVHGRVSPNVFPQNQAWPALIYTFISTVPDVDICGDGGDETAQIRVQIDGAAKTYVEMRALRSSVMSAMKTFPVPAICEGGFDDYEPDTRAHRCSLDFVLHPSSA